MKTNGDLPVFIHWTDFLEWLFNRTESFPKRIRFTFSQRIENLALDIILELVEARYCQEKKAILQSINLKLEQLRVLLRLCFKQHFLNQKQYEYASRQVNETGKMVGGWYKQQQK